MVSLFINPTHAPASSLFPRLHRQNALSQLQFSSSILPLLRAGSLTHQTNKEVSLTKSQITRTGKPQRPKQLGSTLKQKARQAEEVFFSYTLEQVS